MRKRHLTFRTQSLPATLLLLLIASVGYSLAACPTVFHAQAISQREATLIDYYYSRKDIPSAAECATFCGRRELCRTAVYNHNAKTCALSYVKVVDCRLTKQRYNTFHLAADGTEPLSVISCIDHCPKGRAPSTLFVQSEPSEFVQKPGLHDGKATVPNSKVPDVQSYKENGEPVGRKYGANFRVDAPTAEVIRAIQRLEKEIEAQTHSSLPKSGSASAGSFSRGSQGATSKPPELITAGNQPVLIKAAPLRLEEVYNGSTNAANASGAVDGADGAIRTFRNGSESKAESGGLFKWLKPGEPLKLPENVKLPEGLPQLLITIAPELFGFATPSRVPTERVNVTGKAKVEEITATPTPDASSLLTKSGVGSFTSSTRGTLVLDGRIRVEGAKEEFTTSSSTTASSTPTTTKDMFDLEEITTTQPLTLAPEPEPSTSAEQDLARSGGDNGPVDPIVVNGRLLTSGEAKALASYERTTTTTTTVTPPWKPAGAFGETSAGDASVPDQSDNTDDERESRQKPPEQLDEGFVNTFFIKGLSSMFKGDEKDFQRQRERALTTSTTPAPIVCYRLIPQQLLLYAGYRTHAGVTLNQCRCLCAETWRDENSSENKCKSVQYDEKKKECTLNEADHNGKYDLIYNKNVDYHYVSCDVQFLLSTGARMCHWNEKSISEDGKSVDKEHPVVVTTTTTHSTIDVPDSKFVSTVEKHVSEAVSSSSAEWTTTTRAPKSTTKPTKAVAKSGFETTKPSKAEFTMEKPDRRKHPQATTTKKTTKAPSRAPTPKATDGSTKTTETTTVQTTYLTTTIDNPQTEKPSVEESDIPKLPEAATGDKDVKLITTNRTMPSDMMKEKAKKESKKASKSATTTIEPVQKKPDLEVKVSGCFEVIEGHVMRGTAGGLEHDVTLEECECFCANSLASRRYVFQCLSATYYHRERDCILNVDNRQVHPEVFERNEQEEYNVTYLGMTCGVDKARVVHVDDTLPNGCLRETTPATTTTTAKTTTTPAHSDDCFLELPNYVLEGQALAIENNVTVEECKCYCVDSEHRYGSECQSVQYFYDSGTCLLNKENRITDPDRFSYDPHGGVMSSYFDYRCHAEKMVLSVYVEQICQQIVDIKISDVIKMTTAASLDKEEGANEVRSVTRVIDTPLSEENTSDQLESIALKSHSAEHEGRIVKEITDTMPATTTTASTTSTARGLKKMTSNAATTPISSTTTVTSTTTSTETTTTAVKEKAKTALTKKASPKKLATTTSTTTSKPENATTTTLPETAENATTSDATNETPSTTIPATNATEKATASTVPTTSSTTTAPMTSAERKTKKLTKSTEATTPLPFDSEEGVSEEELPTKPPPPRRPSRPIKKGRRPLVTTPKPIPEREELESGELGQQELEAETTEPPTTTTTGYQPVGPCRYSALYQTVFNGGRLIKRLMVTSPAQCFAACHHERCRSANLIQSEGVLKVCELFRDSIVDFRRTDVLGFDRGAVHFDSIQCEELSQ